VLRLRRFPSSSTCSRVRTRQITHGLGLDSKTHYIDAPTQIERRRLKRRAVRRRGSLSIDIVEEGTQQQDHKGIAFGKNTGEGWQCFERCDCWVGTVLYCVSASLAHAPLRNDSKWLRIRPSKTEASRHQLRFRKRATSALSMGWANQGQPCAQSPSNLNPPSLHRLRPYRRRPNIWPTRFSIAYCIRMTLEFIAQQGLMAWGDDDHSTRPVPGSRWSNVFFG
jgi:hypothetical protein